MRSGLAASVLSLFLGLGEPMSAQARSPFELKHDLRADGAVTGGGIALWLTLSLLGGRLVPDTCRWCDSPKRPLNGVDAAARRALRWSDPGPANLWSDVLAFALIPLATYGIAAAAASASDRLGSFPLDALLITEAVTISSLLSQVTKLIFARERPYLYGKTDHERRLLQKPSGRQSFYSGHTSLGFSLVVAGGTVASLRGYAWAPAVWAVGVPLAALTGYLRIAADQHYFTDVLAGALVGSLVGFVIPFVFHGRKQDAQPSAKHPGPSPRAAVPAALSWRW